MQQEIKVGKEFVNVERFTQEQLNDIYNNENLYRKLNKYEKRMYNIQQLEEHDKRLALIMRGDN